MTSDTEEKGKIEKDDVFEFNEKDEGNVSDQSSAGSPAQPGSTDDLGKKNKPKPKRKRLLKDVNAPKAPLTGYVRFLNERREKYREEHPDVPYHEITKILGQKWSSMSQEEKQQYLEEAEKEREKYAKALEGYQQTPAYKEFQQLKKRKAGQNEEGKESPQSKPSIVKEDFPKSVSLKCNGDNTVATTAVVTQGPKISRNGAQIPIFTEQFLEYSRQRESELRQLRKDNLVYEEQNALLNKQIDHMKSVMERVKSEIMEHENENSNMQHYLDKFRKVLHEKFDKLTFPDALNEKMSSEGTNIDKKLTQLSDYLSATKGDEVVELKKKMKDFIKSLDYPALKNL